MSDKERQTPQAGSTDGEQPEDLTADKASGPGADDATAADVEALRQALQEAQAKAQEHWDRLVRATAELDNVRKRADREVEAARKYALEKFATELLAVRDSLEMGLASARDANEAGDSHVQGMELTLKMLSGVMDKFGVQPVDPVGQPFNPEFHEAMSMQESSAQPSNTVLSVLQKGYVLNERLLRPAMVVVAKAPQQNAGDAASS